MNRSFTSRPDESERNFNGTGSTLVLATIRGNVLYVAISGTAVFICCVEPTRADHEGSFYVEELVAMGKLKRGSRDYMEKKISLPRV